MTRKPSRSFLGAGPALLALLLCAAPAAAQVKPKIMVIFDTSGSMYTRIRGGAWIGDGSDLCGGRGKDSRIYILKEALMDALLGLGSGEVDLALATYPMLVDPRRQPYCGMDRRCSGARPTCSGHYFTDYGTGVPGLATGCKVSTHNDRLAVIPYCGNTPSPCAAWYLDYKAEVLKVPFGKPIRDIMLYFDQKEDTGRVARLTNPEVRAGNGWLTPIGKSLYYAFGYFHREVALPPSDYRKKCERLAIAFFTDGVESCNTSSRDFYYPRTWARNLLGVLGVRTHVVAVNTSASLLGQIARDGGGTYTPVSSGGKEALRKAFLDIIARSMPPTEKCNGLDDDCDAKVDEDFPQKGTACNNGQLGACFRTGVYVCKADGSGVTCNAPAGVATPEVCNGIDDDCNGKVDDGIPGGCTPCVPTPEICDGKDNDCNGKIDDGYVSVPCGSTVGECRAGRTACVAGKVVCVGGTGPGKEICDGKDNDCDTVVDGFTESCFPYATGCDVRTGVCRGVCRVGVRACTAGSYTACVGAIGPTKEVCNGLDDDCDGVVDDGVLNTCTNYSTCTKYTTCGPCPPKPPEVCNGKDDDCNGKIDDSPLVAGTPCGRAVGECKRGVWQCVAGKLTCKQDKGTTEICDGKDNDCNGKIDDKVPGAGTVCGSSVGECRTGTWQCVAAKAVCVGEVKPKREICDGKDNDCDGKIDNGIPATPCGSDIGECRAGRSLCIAGKSVCVGAKGPSAEVCNGKDDDCNGVVDDAPTDVGKPCGKTAGECRAGVTRCIGGKPVCWGEVKPKTEICNGKDDDCNGKIDDTVPGVGDACGIDTGECKKGKKACKKTASGWALVCDGVVGPVLEVCDGKDNDCDGKIDEDFPRKGRFCGKAIGECRPGAYACVSGKEVCKGAIGPTAELCNGKDDDCNGAIDDKVKGEGGVCGKNVGVCKQGRSKCVGGKFVCVGGVGPTPEVCNGLDDDCDGKADEFAKCPGKSKCIEGRCAVPCTSGEFNCPGGTRCVKGFCVEDKCARVKCKATERCVKGACVSKCQGVRCEFYERCEPTTGRCVDDSCVTKGCPKKGEVCIDHRCQPNPCPPGKCKADEICDKGTCLPACLNVSCKKGEVCRRGKCVEDPCRFANCPENHVCEVVRGKATCVADPCAVVRCSGGRICRQGKCIADPCLFARCPTGLTCQVDRLGVVDCVKEGGKASVTSERVLAMGGGGFGCGQAGGGPPGWPGLLAGLALVALARRRRHG